MGLISVDQILAHLVGDYIIQSHWMATEKTKRHIAALLHAVTYAVPFLFITTDWHALAFIIIPHYYIDRYRLARLVVMFKNAALDFGEVHYREPWQIWRTPTYATPTGYPAGTPDWLAVWLLIIADNTLHLITNGLAIKYLG